MTATKRKHDELGNATTDTKNIPDTDPKNGGLGDVAGPPESAAEDTEDCDDEDRPPCYDIQLNRFLNILLMTMNHTDFEAR